LNPDEYLIRIRWSSFNECLPPFGGLTYRRVTQQPLEDHMTAPAAAKTHNARIRCNHSKQCRKADQGQHPPKHLHMMASNKGGRILD